MPPSPCLNCGRINDGAVNAMGMQHPEPGDITICLQWRHIMAYDADMKLRALTDDEVVKIAGDKKIVRVIEAMGKLASDEERKKWKRRRA